MSSYSDAELVVAAAAGKEGSRPVRINCPLCIFYKGKADRRQSLKYTPSTGGYGCFRCGQGGRVPAALSGARIDVEEVEVETILGPPESFVELASHDGLRASVFRAAWAYVLLPTAEGGRGLDEELVAEARIGACARGKFAGRVVVPVFDRAGDWAWYVGRVWKKKGGERPYLYPRGGRMGVMFNEAALDAPTDEPAYVVEGCFDALSLWPDGVAVLGKPAPAQVRALVETDRPLVIVLDGDANDDAFALAYELRLSGKEDVGIIELPPKVDPDECVAAVRACARKALEDGQAAI